MAKCENFAGQANNYIAIQVRTDTGDAYGGQTVNWTTATPISAWAIIEPQSGREVYAQGQNQSRVDSKMTIRYNAALKDTAVTGKYRVVWDSRTFNVLYVKNLDDDMKREGKAFQVLYCGENAPENS